MKTIKILSSLILLFTLLATAAEQEEITVYHNDLLKIDYVNCADIEGYTFPKTLNKQTIHAPSEYEKETIKKKLRGKGIYILTRTPLYKEKDQKNRDIFYRLAVYKIDRTPINNHEDFDKFLKGCKPGQEIKLYFRATRAGSGPKDYPEYQAYLIMPE